MRKQLSVMMAMAMLLGFSCIGCDDDGTETTETCTENATMCSANVLMSCSGGNWTAVQTCPNGCNGNACASGTTTVCTAGSTKCENNVSYSCSNNAWNLVQACPYGCNGNTCATSTEATCTDGAVQCNGAYIQTCTGGSWVQAATACANGCTNGVCNSSGGTDTPVSGGSCNADTYSDNCANNTVYYCSESKIVAQECGDYACKVSSADGYGTCSMTCEASEKGEVGAYYCYEYSGVDIAIPYVCQLATDGTYAWLPSTSEAEYCSGSCSETSGCSGSTGFTVCDDTCMYDDSTSCADYCKKNESSDVCYMDDESFYCEDMSDVTGADISWGDDCSEVGKKQASCGYDSDYGAYFTDYYVCTADDEYGNYWELSSDSYDACNNKCNDDGTACDSQGSESYKYQSE